MQISISGYLFNTYPFKYDNISIMQSLRRVCKCPRLDFLLDAVGFRSICLKLNNPRTPIQYYCCTRYTPNKKLLLLIGVRNSFFELQTLFWFGNSKKPLCFRQQQKYIYFGYYF